MTGRWKVRRERGIFWDEDDELRDGPRWHVTSPTGVPWGNFATHTEAMAKADKEACTTTVTLPRKPGMVKIGKRKHALVTRTKNGGTALYFMDDWGDDQAIFMKTKYLEPFALALLAHARRKHDRP